MFLRELSGGAELDFRLVPLIAGDVWRERSGVWICCRCLSVLLIVCLSAHLAFVVVLCDRLVARLA